MCVCRNGGIQVSSVKKTEQRNIKILVKEVKEGAAEEFHEKDSKSLRGNATTIEAWPNRKTVIIRGDYDN